MRCSYTIFARLRWYFGLELLNSRRFWPVNWRWGWDITLHCWYFGVMQNCSSANIWKFHTREVMMNCTIALGVFTPKLMSLLPYHAIVSRVSWPPQRERIPQIGRSISNYMTTCDVPLPSNKSKLEFWETQKIIKNPGGDFYLGGNRLKYHHCN